jgi:hypothetical protein
MTTGNSITLPDLPTVGTSAVNKTYVDSRVSPVIATIAALRLTTTTTLTAVVCTVQNYAATSTGSNGGGQFMYVASDTTSADDGGTIIVDASSRRWYRVAADGRWLNVMWFGATGNSTTNDGPAIQAAINSVQAGGGGTVYLPEGVYAHSATLLISQSGVRLVGAGYDAEHDFAGSWTNTDNTRPVTALLWTGANLGVQVQVMPTGSGTVWNDNGAALGGCAVLNMCLFAGTTPYTVAASVGVMGKCIKDCEFSFFALEHKTAGLLLGTLNRTPANWNNSAAFNRIPYLGYRGTQAASGGAVRLENTGVSTDQGNAYNNLFGLVNVLHNNGHAIDLASCDNNVFQMVRIQRLTGGTGTGVYFRCGTFGNGMARANVFNLLSPGAGGVYSEASVSSGTVLFPAYENKILFYNPDENGAPGYPAIGNGLDGSGNLVSSSLYYSRTKEAGACYFTVTINAAQTIPSAAWTIVHFNTVEEDPASWFDTTNFRWTPRYPGRWDINVTVLLQVNAVAGTRQIQLNKNANVTIARSVTITRGIGQETISVSGSVQFDGHSDYLMVEVWQDSGANATVVYDTFSTNAINFMGTRAA